MLDQSYIGREYPPSAPYVVSAEKIREFADAVGERSPLCHDAAAARAAGHPDVIAPPTFLTLVNMRAIDTIISDPELGIDYSRMVHGSQSFSLDRPVHAGDRVVVTSHVDDIMARAGNDFLTVRAEVATEDGDRIGTARAQLVVRGETA